MRLHVDEYDMRNEWNYIWACWKPWHGYLGVCLRGFCPVQSQWESCRDSSVVWLCALFCRSEASSLACLYDTYHPTLSLFLPCLYVSNKKSQTHHHSHPLHLSSLFAQFMFIMQTTINITITSSNNNYNATNHTIPKHTTNIPYQKNKTTISIKQNKKWKNHANK